MTEVMAPDADAAFAIRKALYLRDPVLFVQEELGEEPSADQAEFLKMCANLDNFYHIVAAGRGAGKTKCVAWLVCWSVAVLPEKFGTYECVILGGSAEQSKYVYEFFTDYIYQTPFLQNKLVGEPTRSETNFTDARVKALAASEKQVRGPHPDLLVIDEAMVAEDEIIYSALMQESGPGHGRIVMLSTPHRQSGLFREYWEKADEYDYMTHGPWPLTNCHWIAARKIAHWKKTLPPDKYKADVLGEFASSKLNVFDREDILAAFSHGRWEFDPNYAVMTGIDWGFSVSDTVFLPGQDINNILCIPGPENIKEHMRYPKVMQWATRKYFPTRKGKIYSDGSHPSEIQRMELLGLEVVAVHFVSKKVQLTEIIETLLYQRRIKISDDNVVLKRQLLNHARDAKDKIIKKDDDTVDALRCLVHYKVDEGFTDADIIGGEEGDAKPRENEWGWYPNY